MTRAGRWAHGLTLALVLAACRGKGPATPTLFDRLAPSTTGVTFENTLPEAADFNILNYLYYYNGGGVAAGDVNGDGLPDLYFTSNLGENKLYLNKGQYQFEDVTAKAMVGGPAGWKTGVAMADVNGDGRLDIYVSSVSYLTMHGTNALYINNGDGTFVEQAKEYGLDHVGYSTQAAFFDYDGDGDLDMFLLSHSTHTERAIGTALKRDVRSPLGGGRLYRNEAGKFVDVSAEAGIFGGIEGYGLGVVISDLNADGCPDIYVSNDFQENDFLYYNTCKGTFVESITTATRHTSRFSMGVDAADINNDGRPDLFVSDMFPEREDVLKTSASSEPFNTFMLRLQAGYHPQYARNTLQLNRGDGHFSDIALLAGVSATDWSWSALFADLDNDGQKDLFVTNGIFRRPNDLDYINYVGNAAVQASLATGVKKEDLALLKQLPQIPIPNHLFRNDGQLHFTDVAEAWGLGTAGFSNGAVYADLNNSGSLDLVINNVNAPATVYRNNGRAQTRNGFLSITLRGAGKNTAGIGAKVKATDGSVTQWLEQSPVRGFQSSVDPRLHFGFARSSKPGPEGDLFIDSLVVIWPDRRMQRLTHVALNQQLTLKQDEATEQYTYPAASSSGALFQDVTDTRSPAYRHLENTFSDFDREPLMPKMVSAEGPALAVGDVNGDGLEDLYAGGAKWQPGQLLLQQRDGTFRQSAEAALAADSLNEDVDAVFVDVNGDRALDLVVVSGGNEFWEGDALRPRLYLNDGRGHFRRDVAALPAIFENASCVVAGDFTGDGVADLFIGGRVVSKNYGKSPRSYLLQNDGKGHFTDVTAAKAPGLVAPGMITSAAWVDYDADGKLDLIVAGDWMPVTVFHQEKGRFVDRTSDAGLAGTEGWWNVVQATDLTGDGRADLVLGNLGLNSYITASTGEPARMQVYDFGGTGALKQIVSFYKQGISYPMAGRDDIVKLIPSLRAKYPSFKSFGASRVEEIFPAAELQKAAVLSARTFASAVAVSNGKRGFTLQPLPVEAQMAPTNAVVAGDFDGDGKVDLVLAGNVYGVPPLLGRYDAGYGLFLHGTGDGTFRAVDLAQSKLVLDGEVRHLRRVRGANGASVLVAARNNDRLQILRPLH